MKTEHPSVPAALLRDPLHLVALGFGSGCAPRAPGTSGTVIGVAFYLLMASLSLPWYIALTLLAFLLGVWVCERTSARLGVHDHPAIVWDEAVGYLVTMIAAPQGLLWAVAGFLLFRAIDIVKPWPIRWLDRQVGGGWGIMVDDTAAGLMALALLQLIAHVVQR
jgi:phosphatidylglycerophosphatase A